MPTVDHWFQLVRFDLQTDEVTSPNVMSSELDFVICLTAAEGSAWASGVSWKSLLRLQT